MVLYLPRTLTQIFVIYWHRTQPIFLPKEREMTVYLINQNWRKWFAGKSCKQKSPVVKIRSITLIVRSLVVVLNNLNEGTHDLWEANDTNQHVEDSNDDLVNWNWEVVTITNGWKGGEGEVANDDNLGENVLRAIFFFPFFNLCFTWFYMCAQCVTFWIICFLILIPYICSRISFLQSYHI